MCCKFAEKPFSRAKCELLLTSFVRRFSLFAGPWNHSFRLEHKLGTRLKVVALIDPSAARANAALDAKKASFVEQAYAGTLVYNNVLEYSRAVQGGGAKQPQ